MLPLASLKQNFRTELQPQRRCMLRRDHNNIYVAFHRFLSEEAQLVLSVLSWHKIAK
jgi:hypothetical protein